MKINFLIRSLLGLVAATLTVSPVYAQSDLALEEIIVTATKREVGLQDVPIAMSVVSGEKIEQFGVTELDELAAYLPGIHIGESGGNNQVFIRGVGSGNNAGFEQSVGTFIDGVYFGRARNSRAAFLDIERVEVLKGPQSTLFGKNTVAGAINITTAQPQDSFEAYVDVGYESELNGKSLTAMVTGPLSDSVRGRLVAKTYERDGWMKNIFPGGEDGPSQDNTIMRGTLAWDATEQLSVNLKVEHGNFKTVGSTSKETIASPGSTYLNGLKDPNYAAATGFNYNQSQSSGYPGRPIEDDMENDILQLTIDYQIGEHTLRSISAKTNYKFGKCTDVDYASIDFIDQCIDEEHDQFTQEFLLSSPEGQTVEYLAGLYYQDATLEFANTLGVLWSSVPPLEAGLFGMLGLPHPALSGAIDANLNTALVQSTETISAFAEITWNMSDAFRTTFGLRYSEDEKDVNKVNVVDPWTGTTPIGKPMLGGVYSALSFFKNYQYALDRSESHVTGNVNFQYNANDDIMAYLNLATGYKAGGFDTSNNMDRSREFEDESVDSIELGLKMTLLDGRGRVNVAVFQGDYKDVQVSTFESAGFIVGNAAESKVKGLEADFEIALTEMFGITGGVSLLNAEYGSYTGAGCQVPQILAGTCSNKTGGQDLSGTPLQFAPDVSGNLGITFSAPLNDDMDLHASVDILYTDDILIGPDNDPATIQDSYSKINARIGLSANDGSWSLALVGKNLTDELTFNWGNDTTLSGSRLGFDGTYFHQFEAPRTLEIQARRSF